MIILATKSLFKIFYKPSIIIYYLYLLISILSLYISSNTTNLLYYCLNITSLIIIEFSSSLFRSFYIKGGKLSSITKEVKDNNIFLFFINLI